ncbi:MAG: M23 family metallopeptidase, partial [Propionibacteriaceae bacterium]|nr:M23 family metallopeptidase [Propionibacteriaceae bacterium]
MLVLGTIAPLWSVGQPALAEPVLPIGVRPVTGEVVRAFDPPAEKWLAGHRGVDLSAQAGDIVVAAAAGQVRFAGLVAGRGVVSLDHAGVITTYEPVTALVAVGDRVAAGTPIGVLDSGHACPAPACLHWGLKMGETYL